MTETERHSISINWRCDHASGRDSWIGDLYHNPQRLWIHKRFTLAWYAVTPAQHPAPTILLHKKERHLATVAGPVVWNSLPAAVRHGQKDFLPFYVCVAKM